MPSVGRRLHQGSRRQRVIERHVPGWAAGTLRLVGRRGLAEAASVVGNPTGAVPLYSPRTVSAVVATCSLDQYCVHRLPLDHTPARIQAQGSGHVMK